MWGQGPKTARVMIVCDAPGSTDDKLNKVLQGQSGKLLLNLLDQAGVAKSDCYITHAVKCHPPEDRPPSALELKTCKVYLEAEIEQVNPEFIITLGAVALKTLVRKAKVTESHGQVLPLGSAKLFPTFHPGVALRDPTKLPPLTSDIKKFGRLFQGHQPPTEEGFEYTVIRNLATWNKFIEDFNQADTAAADIETTGLDRLAPGAAVNTIQFSLPNGNNWTLPLSVRDSPWKDKPAQQQTFMNTIVEQAEGKIIIGQNFKFDNLWLKTHYGVKFKLRFDTQLAHHTLDENSPHGLKDMAATYCDAPSYDVDLKTKLGLGDLTKFYKYGAMDTHWTLELYEIFRAMFLKDPSLRRLFYQLVMPAARMFEDIEEDGHFINLEQLEETGKVLNRRKEELLAKLRDMVGAEINWNSPAQVADLFFNTLGLDVIELTDSGAPSTAETVLLRLDHPIAKVLMEYRGVEKNLSTYVDGWKKLMYGDRLYLSTKLHGTVTGRYASRLHQVPRDPMIRSHIDAPEGWTMVVADYSQIELRLAAMVANEPRMKMIFQSGGDIHKSTASFVLGKPEDQLTSEERKLAKAINFGLIYGMQYLKLIIYARDNYGVDMSPQEAKEFRTRYFEVFSALPAWHARQRRTVKALGQVVSLSGRVRRLPGIYSTSRTVVGEAERQAINSPIQGFGSGDLKAMAMVEIHDTFSLDDVRIKGEVHDSILMWVRSDIVDQTVPKLKAIMESPHLLEVFKINFTVPLVADFEIGPWGKGTKWKPPVRRIRKLN